MNPNETWLQRKARQTLDDWYIEAAKCKLMTEDYYTIDKFKAISRRLALRAKTQGLIFHDSYIDMHFDCLEKLNEYTIPDS